MAPSWACHVVVLWSGYVACLFSALVCSKGLARLLFSCVLKPQSTREPARAYRWRRGVGKWLVERKCLQFSSVLPHWVCEEEKWARPHLWSRPENAQILSHNQSPSCEQRTIRL